jgi:hypothetical protein
MVSFDVLTAAADDALPLPTFARALVEAFLAELAAMLAAVLVVAVVDVATVPTTALVACVPLAVPPEVLTKMSLRVCGDCQ